MNNQIKHKRFIKYRKYLSNEEARRRIANCQQALTVCEDNLNYARQSLGKLVTPIDSFILGIDGLISWEEFIHMIREDQNYLIEEINDYKRFLTESYKRFIF